MTEEKKLLFLARGEIRTARPFRDLFQIKPNDLKHIADDMRKNGYDFAHPIILWHGAVVDGHTRLAAAELAGVGDIPVVPRNFKDEREALEYAIKSQSNRRNLSDAELMACIGELDKRMATGRRKECASREAHSKVRSSENTADLLGVSRAKIERIRAVQDHASSEVKDAVAAGKISVNRAYNETMRQRRNDDGDENIGDLKNTRLEAMAKSIDGMITNRLTREIQEYPQLGYSAAEKEKLAAEISKKIRQHIITILHGEEE